jgi:16S rRNA (cytosine1402-N4)-methyltransferase
VGGGGHTEVILQKIGQNGHLLGLDTDASTLTQTKDRLHTYPNTQFVHAWFDELESVAEGENIKTVDAILFDLGFSSLQLDNPERGLSFQADGPLDMRLDASDAYTAADIINKSNEKQLADILYRYGELYDARRIAKTIVDARYKQPITRTHELIKILGLSNPGVKAKLFQALRIAVNQELTRLEQAIPQAVSLLSPGGRVAIITFHSLEDRIVKTSFRDNHLLELINKKPIIPTDEEVKANPRSRSAKLRIAQKITT